MNKEYTAPSVEVIEFDTEIKTGIETPEFDFDLEQVSEPTEQII